MTIGTDYKWLDLPRLLFLSHWQRRSLWPSSNSSTVLFWGIPIKLANHYVRHLLRRTPLGVARTASCI